MTSPMMPLELALGVDQMNGARHGLDLVVRISRRHRVRLDLDED